jgi:hypothetical protein
MNIKELFIGKRKPSETFTEQLIEDDFPSIALLKSPGTIILSISPTNLNNLAIIISKYIINVNKVNAEEQHAYPHPDSTVLRPEDLDRLVRHQ